MSSETTYRCDLRLAEPCRDAGGVTGFQAAFRTVNIGTFEDRRNFDACPACVLKILEFCDASDARALIAGLQRQPGIKLP